MPAADYLRRKGIRRLDALVVTHFHSDHIYGIEEILNDFEVGRIIIPSVFSLKSDVARSRIKAMCQKARNALADTTDQDVVGVAKSFIELLTYIYRNSDKVEEVVGPENIVRIAGMPEASLRVFLPLPRTKSLIHNVLEKDNFEISHFPQMNDSSVAAALDINGWKVLLTGDSTRSQWLQHYSQMNRGGVTSMKASVVKAPHHGSKENTVPDLLDYWYGEDMSGLYYIVSANGRSHPHDDVLRMIDERGLLPFCTNLAVQCGKDIAEVVDMNYWRSLATDIRAFLTKYEEVKEQPPCQGDVTVTIEETSALRVTSSTGTPCIYRT